LVLLFHRPGRKIVTVGPTEHHCLEPKPRELDDGLSLSDDLHDDGRSVLGEGVLKQASGEEGVGEEVEAPM
jgi:hypothetical protein